ncbi:FAD-dependent oxidoreductase [uncultured Maritalea sp.]|uniref:FAD-dependent oxidoreductase n=1 Tax=uncultured Maritalea sp. TaxID=757249 RepID=UPI00345DCF47
MSHKWAGLRNFVSTKAPIFGFDDDQEGFFWLAGQGGYGIQTAPAIATAVADLMKESAGLASEQSFAEELASYNPAIARTA